MYVSFSGGKDSTVLLHIVKKMYPDVPAVFCDTGLEYPEVRKHGIKHADVKLKPKMNFKQVIEKYGYPFPSKEQAQYIRQYKHSKSEKLRNYRWSGDEKGRFKISEKWKFLCDTPFEFSERCCDVMKKEPFKRYEKETGRKPFVGTMASESILRKNQYLRHGCNAFGATREVSTPMAFWTEKDVLEYIKENGIEIASCYGEVVSHDGITETTGVDRTGCMFCMFGVHLEKEPNRFQKMRENYPKQWEYCIRKLGIGDVLDCCDIPYGED